MINDDIQLYSYLSPIALVLEWEDAFTKWEKDIYDPSLFRKP
jgi:hypothetical protein